MLNFQVDVKKCTKCDACVKDCPSGIISRKEGAMPEATGTVCLECQHCLAVCPAAAVSIFGLKPENSLPLSYGAIPSYMQMKTFVRGRRSVRQFGDEDVARSIIDKLLADLAHSPTGCNDRDLIFSVVDNRNTMNALLEKIMQAAEARQKSGETLPGFIDYALTSYRSNGSDVFFRGAPHLLVVSHGEKAHVGQEDVVLSLAYFEFLAQSVGLGTTWCGMIKFAAEAIPEIREYLGVAPNAYFYAMMFGKPAVRYARTVQRDQSAQIRRIEIA